MMKILIVDDEKIIREGLLKCIDWTANEFKVMGTAANGHEALEQCKENMPEIIITDIQMPKMNGLQLTREIKAMNESVRIIFLTGYNEFEYARQGIELGIDSYILKPVDPDALLEKVIRIRDDIIVERKNWQDHKILENKYLTLSGTKSPNQEVQIKSRKIIEDIKKYIGEYYATDLNLNKLAEKFQLSYNYICQLFKKETGYNLMEYLNFVRIEKAKELIKDPTIKIYEIGYQVGIDGSHHFSKLFKKFTGVSPTAYRDNSAE